MTTPETVISADDADGSDEGAAGVDGPDPLVEGGGAEVVDGDPTDDVGVGPTVGVPDAPQPTRSSPTHPATNPRASRSHPATADRRITPG